jgi:hypothetical protein
MTCCSMLELFFSFIILLILIRENLNILVNVIKSRVTRETFHGKVAPDRNLNLNLN